MREMPEAVTYSKESRLRTQTVREQLLDLSDEQMMLPSTLAPEVETTGAH